MYVFYLLKKTLLLLSSVILPSSVLSADPPDPPTRLKIQSVRKGTVTLTWKAPKNDGGSPVTHYSVDLLCWDASGTQKESWRR